MAYSSDPEQLTGDVLRLGTVASVDHANGTCTVESGDVVTGPLPWVAFRAGGVRLWSPPTVGEQCLLLSPEGDLKNGIVLTGLYCDAFPAPSVSPDLVHLEFADGAIIAYDQVAHALSVTLPGGGTAQIDAPGGTVWNGPVTFNDDVTVNATVTATTDVIGGGKSLKGHKHSGVQTGSAQTGAPV
jgi:phage baseplate assembly protein V